MASPKLATYAIYRGDELLDVGTRMELSGALDRLEVDG